MKPIEKKQKKPTITAGARTAAAARRFVAWQNLKQHAALANRAGTNSDVLRDVADELVALDHPDDGLPNSIDVVRKASEAERLRMERALPDLRAAVVEFYDAEADAICCGAQMLGEAEGLGPAAAKEFAALIDEANARLADYAKEQLGEDPYGEEEAA